jgi:hypothetical protein
MTNPPILSFSVKRHVHNWLRKTTIAFHPGPLTPMLEKVANGLLEEFKQLGHNVLAAPRGKVDIILTTAALNVPVNWREALMFRSRRLFRLDSNPTVFTLIHARRDELQRLLEHLGKAAAKPKADPAEYDFPGLAPRAYATLYEQGRREGPFLSLVRLLQAQSMSIRIILLVGEDEPDEAYTIDLVGGHPKTICTDLKSFYNELVLRILTAVSTHEITDHQLLDNPVDQVTWKSLATPAAMRKAGSEFGRRNFFTQMVEVGALVNVPTLNDRIASQYSEGCYATWEPRIDALLSTITGSARPVDKEHLTDDELAVITAVRPDGAGAIIRHVAGKRNDPPSSEAVELISMDTRLPRISLKEDWGIDKEVPVVRSKLHGHRSVRSYDPNFVEHVHLDPEYYAFPVSCSTEAQARGIVAAFSRSEALTNPGDPRQLVFLVLPGHGMIVVEKWVKGKEPFQAIWEAMDSGCIEIDSLVPQGSFDYKLNMKGRRVITISA